MDIYENIKQAKKEFNNCKEKIILEMDNEDLKEIKKKRKKGLREIFYDYKK